MTNDIEAEYLRNIVEFQPWLPKPRALLEEQAAIRDVLARHAGARHIGNNVYIARGARILTGNFSIGDESWVAAGAIIRGDVTLGRDCTVNPYAHIAGSVRIGDGVRIAGMVSIYGFNHGYARTDIPIFMQPYTCQGIEIGDGCWIGANAAIVDGVKIGAHSIVAAGAVVTASFPAYSILGGVPARLISNRRAQPGQSPEG